MNVVVVGGGLVGSLQALMLARLGYDVRLYDTRLDPRIGHEEGKSINLALSTRGRKALESVECEAEVLATSVPMRGRYIHNTNGTHFTLDYSPAGDCIHSVNRKKLNELLLEKAEEKGVKLFFRHKCVSVNFAYNSVSFETLDKLDGSDNPLYRLEREVNDFSLRVSWSSFGSDSRTMVFKLGFNLTRIRPALIGLT